MDVIDRLARHGVEMTTISEGIDVVVDQIRFTDVHLATAVSERRVKVAADTSRSESRQTHYPEGSVYISTDQPLGDLAIHMLEPACPDSLFAHGFITGCLDEVEYIEGYVVAPMAEEMLNADPELRRLFEEELARNPAFAADPIARLKWFYARSPYRDESYLLYPIGRVTQTR
jgi:hypothetical protein